MKSGNGFRTVVCESFFHSHPERQLRKQLKWMSFEKKGNGSDGSSSKICNEESSTLYKEACRQLLRSGVGWHRVLTPQILCVMTGWKHKLFAFRGAQEWKNLPSDIWTIQYDFQN